MVKNHYRIEGMTCQSCVEKVTEKIQSLNDVSKVQVSLENKLINIESKHGVDLHQVKGALQDLPKYSIFEGGADLSKKPEISDVKESAFKTYKPLIVVISFIFLISLSVQITQGSFSEHQFMNHIMSGFFIGFSLFKFLDLKSFSESFSTYDPIAQRYLGYGLIYPFIEFILGLMYLNSFKLFIANIITIIILTVTTAGIIKRLQSKSMFQCACLGAAFSLPLSYVTVFENGTMILMATYSLFQILN